jgi:hypothetical protein
MIIVPELDGAPRILRGDEDRRVDLYKKTLIYLSFVKSFVKHNVYPSRQSSTSSKNLRYLIFL